MATEKVRFTEEKETMLATLYGRALDSRTRNPILDDHTAADTVDRIDYDFTRAKIGPSAAAGVAIRASWLDGWTREFLAAHPESTVLHLGCGLDTRVYRLDPPASVRWYDIDYPETVELRERLYPARDGYRMIGASVTDEAWLSQIPDDRPTVMVAEGLTMYLVKPEGQRLFRRIVDTFPSGQLIFDAYSDRGIRMQKRIPAVRNAGATLHWGINEAEDIEQLHPDIRCIDSLRSTDLPGLERLPLRLRVAVTVMGWIPGINDIARMMRFGF